MGLAHFQDIDDSICNCAPAEGKCDTLLPKATMTMTTTSLRLNHGAAALRWQPWTDLNGNFGDLLRTAASMAINCFDCDRAMHTMHAPGRMSLRRVTLQHQMMTWPQMTLRAWERHRGDDFPCLFHLFLLLAFSDLNESDSVLEQHVLLVGQSGCRHAWQA